MPLWKRAIARLVRLLRCSEKRWEQRHGDTLRIARDGLKARLVLYWSLKSIITGAERNQLVL